MTINRLHRSRSKRTNQRLLQSATVARPSLIEPLEDRTLMSLTIDIRVPGGGKTASATSVGQKIALQAWATVTGSTAGANQGLQSVCGSLISTGTSQADSVGGDLLAHLTPDYTANGAQEGTQTDLNGDGNLDVGSNNNADISGFVNARAGGIVQDGVISGNSQSFIFATITYTVTNLHFGSATDVTFKMRNGLASGAYDAVWLQDNAGFNDSTSSVLIGSPVVITDPNLSPPSGSISGKVTKSVNGATSASVGTTVYLDANTNGSLDAGEVSTTTDSNGNYSITGLAAGTYYLREVVPTGYTQTSPSSTPTVITLASNSSADTGENFVDTAAAVKTGSISGSVSKVVSGATSAFTGVTVYLDANNNGSLDSGETSTTTNSSGAYSFSGLAAGTYDVREVVPTGYTQTAPGSSPTVVVLSSGGVVGSQNFTDTANSVTTGGTLLTGSVIGTAGSYQNDGNTIAKAFDGSLATFYDAASASGNWAGLNLGGEFTISKINYAPRSGWAGRMVGGIFQGSNDPNFASGVVNLATITATPATGVYTSVAISNSNAFHYVRYLSPANSYGDVAELQFYGTSAGGTVNTGSISGTVSKVVSGATSAFSGVTVYLDNNNDGIFDSGDTSTTTNSSGAYSFGSLAAGTYHVGEVTPSGYSQTSPGTATEGATLSTSSSAVAGVNFTDTANATTGGNQLTGAVIGTAGSYQNDGNTIAKAFDNNLSTFYDGASANGNWAGLNLGAQSTVTSISYAPRSGWAGRMVGGIFQGSNDPNFATGVVNLATITTTPAVGVLTSISISNTGTFQYVRYLSPSGSYGDVAEVQFFGKSSGAGKLTGAVIGTAGSFNNDGNTIAKAVDGNLSTYFDGPTANGDWVGLNLGSQFLITSVSYAPRSGFTSRMVGGVIQASNDASFQTGVVTLATITSAPTAGVLTTISISNTNTFEFVRYLSPNGGYGNIAELEFFGMA